MITDPHRFVLIYGRSLLLDTVEITLRQNGRFPTLRLSDHTALADVPPGTIIYDQDHVDETAVYQLLSNYPGWQLVGLTASKENLLILSSEKRNGRSLADLISNIQP